MEHIPVHPITLRMFNFQKDVDAFDELVSIFNYMHYSRKAHFFATRAELLDHLNSFIPTHPWFRFICIPRGTAVGFVSIEPDPSGSAGSRITFTVHPAYEQRGVATAAVTKSLTFVFALYPKLMWVDAEVDEINKAALRVLIKAGFNKKATGISDLMEETLLYVFRYDRCEITGAPQKFRHSLGQGLQVGSPALPPPSMDRKRENPDRARNGNGVGSKRPQESDSSQPAGDIRPPRRKPAADDGLVAGSVKTTMCNVVNNPRGCKFGDKCNVAHTISIRELGGPVGPGDGSSEPIAASSGLSGTAKISVDAWIAEDIIRRCGVNLEHICQVTRTKLRHSDHAIDSKRKNFEFEGALEQATEAIAMLRQLIANPQPLAGNSKATLCLMFARGECIFGDSCHFAHGNSKLRRSRWE